MKYPGMRSELVRYLSALGDPKYQEECWVNNRCPEGVEHDELSLSVHFLFDDTSLSEDPARCIGVFLKNLDEAQAVQEVCRALDVVLDEVGPGRPDLAYISSTNWPRVVEAAQRARRSLE